jgi:hypothetical protein
MLYGHNYRADMTPEDSDLLRRLRVRGFALALFSPADVGDPLNRKAVEDQMLKAGRKTIRTIRQERP